MLSQHLMSELEEAAWSLDNRVSRGFFDPGRARAALKPWKDLVC